MNIGKTTYVTVGDYKFKIYENYLGSANNIVTYTFKIGGDYNDCVNLSYIFYNNIPVSASLPHLLYEPECSVGRHLGRGDGSELLIKTLLRYAYKKFSNINIVKFDDMSHIECNEKNMNTSPPRPLKRPLNLSYFSIAYNGMTWYEKRFNAKMSDKKKYAAYKKRLEFLTDPSKKESFDTFLRIVGLTYDQSDKQIILKKYYNQAKTYREFFKLIPFNDRCELLQGWLHNFMRHYLHDVYSNEGWEIDINEMDKKIGGGRKIFPSKYKIINYINMHKF